MSEANPRVGGIGGGESDGQESDLVGVSGKAGLARKRGKCCCSWDFASNSY